MKRFVIAIAACVSLVGCAAAQVKPEDAGRTVFAIYSDYVTAEKIAVQYIRLPRCGSEGALAVCSDPKVVAKIQRVDKLADLSIKAAEAAVRAPEFGDSSISQMVVSARAAKDLFLGITATLKVK